MKNRRVRYAEELLPGEEGARLVLGTFLVDETFSVDYFGDVLFVLRDATRSGTYANLPRMKYRLPIP